MLLRARRPVSRMDYGAERLPNDSGYKASAPAPGVFPQFDPSSTTTALTVTAENSVIDFQRYPAGARKPDLIIIIAKCRADFTMQLTKR